MDAWLNLVKKEFRMTRTSLLLTLGALIIVGLWLMYLSQRYNVPIVMGPAVLLLWVAVFLPGMFMLYSVGQELKHTPNLWLHCPQPAWMLLSAKLVISIITMILILLIEAVFVYWAVLSLDNLAPAGIETQTLLMIVTEVGTYIALGVIAASIYMSSWATLISVVTATARNKLGRLRWLAGVVVFMIPTWGFDKLQETMLFQKLTEWGLFTIQFRSLVNSIHAVSQFNGIPIYTGQIIFTIIVTVAVYALSAWLIDNKVEV